MDNSISQHIETFLMKVAHEHGISKPRLEISTCSGAGDNYVGKVYGISIKDQDSDSEMHVVVKTPPGNKLRRELMRVGVFFRNEVNVYEKILPTLVQFYKQRGVLNGNTPFLNSPRYYGSALSNDENDILVLEDMRPRGFVMADRRTGLDAAHCRLVLRELARLHAASLALQTTNPDLHCNLVGLLTENIFVEPKEGDDKSIEIFCERCRSLIKDRFPEGTKERTKFEEFAGNFGPIMRNFVEKPSKLAVLNHGDAWINNILFRYNKESRLPEELCLIDFQITRYASPVLDLSYFLFTSTTKTLRDRHYQDLMESYHSDLKKFLEALGVDASKIVPWDLFQEELREYGAYGGGMAMMVVPLFLADKNDIVGVDEEIDLQSPETMFLRSSTDENTVLQKRMSDVWEDIVRLGYF